MKTKNNFRVLLFSSVICLLPILLSLVYYNDLPAQIAVHWNNAGDPDSFVPKAVACFGLPLLLLAINLFSKWFLYSDPKRENTSQAMQLFAAWTPPVLSLVLVPVTLFIAMGVNIPISLVASLLVGIVLLVCGNYLPKSRQNYTIGIKLPWTLDNADNWNKTHRLAGYLWMGGGVVFIIGAFIPENRTIWSLFFSIAIVLLLLLVPLLYSYFLYKKSRKKLDETEE